MVSIFDNTLRELKFTSFSIERGGVVLSIDNLEKPSPEILFGIETAKSFFADAVYFRHFPDGRPSVPQIYFFDYTKKKLTDVDKKQIHKRMWSGCTVPIYIIIEKSSVSIFDARAKVDINKNEYAEAIITLTGSEIKEYNASYFDDGLFWESQEKKRFQFESSATRDLIRGLKEVHKSFQEVSGLNRHVSLKLLMQCLLIKYLEERDEESKSGYFAETYFRQNFNCDNFCTTIRKGKLLDLLDLLAKDFNGKIFEWDKEKEKDARQAIRKSEIKILAEYLDGNVENNQYVLWRLYSFSYLPIEVISSVYEELLTDSKDIVYTPEMIVATLIDECMPLKEPQENFKLIDVSCGSGIFLVKAYKRMVQWWRYVEWQKTGKLSKPSLQVLKNILQTSIYGIDIQEDAVRVAVFSLALGILDEVDLNPPTWQILKFPDFSKNIIVKNFFEFISNTKENEYDLVIGNPPFNLPSVEGKEPKRTDYFKSLHKTIGYTCDIDIPDENPALHFLVQSMKLLKPNAQLCLIQPSGPILYHDNTGFKQKLFSLYNLQQLIDFTKLPDIWAGANVATVAVFLQKSLPDNTAILHLVANRTFSNMNRVYLEFDHYDFHFVSKKDALYDPFVWKANLLGGGRISKFINRLSSYRTLGDFLHYKKKTSNWHTGIGFIVGNKKNKADYITGKDFIPVNSLTEEGIVSNDISPCQHKLFERARNKEIYAAPMILIREIIGNKRIPIAFSDRDLVYPFGLIGICAPVREKAEIKKLYDYLDRNNELLRAYLIVTSGRMMIEKATALNKEDIERIPYSENNDLCITEAESIIVNDIIKDTASKVKTAQILNASVFLDSFSSVFCKTLNSVYEEKGKSFKLHKVLVAEKYFALHFEYTSNNITSSIENTKYIEEYIQEVIPTNKTRGENFHIQRIMKIYGQDCIILVKPKQIRYWLPSIALRDADECFADYINVRYSNAER